MLIFVDRPRPAAGAASAARNQRATGANRAVDANYVSPGARRPPARKLQAIGVGLVLTAVFGTIAGQVVRLGQRGDNAISIAMAEPVTVTHSRPDIVDRNGRLLATDVEVHSLYVDPARVLDRDELVEKLGAVLIDLDQDDLRRELGDRNRRFLWLRRGLAPRVAQQVHDLGLPGLSFRRELRRAYPQGPLAGHVLGAVNADNRGISGIERHIDETMGIDAVQAARPPDRPPVRLSIEVAAQAGLERELTDTMVRLDAAGAAGAVIDVATGEIIAAASVPGVEPGRPLDASTDLARRDRLQGGTFEVGSIMKAFTVAMALDGGRAKLDTVLDVRTPIEVGRYTIKDLHPAGRPLSVAEIFTLSSNVGTGMLALDSGTAEQKMFLARAGLLSNLRTEAGPIAAPQIPSRWDKIETITISYGHGMAVAPLQFLAAGAALVNGGTTIEPTYLRQLGQSRAKASDGSRAPESRETTGGSTTGFSDGSSRASMRVISAETSAAMRAVMRANVSEPTATGRRADVPGMEIGGKTGTADIPGPRGYKAGGVISSFFAAFPMSAPRYAALVMVFEPKPKAETGGKVLAGVTAAPAAARILARLGPILDR